MTSAIVVVLLATASVAGADCGDGVVDAGEQCDHGPANGTNDCCGAACTLVDRDLDGLCDAHDGCDRFASFAAIKDPRLIVSGLGTPFADDRLRFDGRVTLAASPPIDPVAGGLRVSVSDSPSVGSGEGVVVLDALLPPGEGWTARGTSAFTYRDPMGTIAGITRVRLTVRPSLVPGPQLVDVVFRIDARRTTLTITPEMVTTVWDGIPVGGRALVTEVALGTPAVPTNARCGSRVYTNGLPAECTFSASGARVRCRGPRPVGPCRLGDPEDLLFCDLGHAVEAQERHFAAHGVYYAGDCTGLPGFVPSPGVVCTTHTADPASEFGVHVSHPSAPTACQWQSNPGGGQNLTCS